MFYSNTNEEIAIDGDRDDLNFAISEKSGNSIFTENDLKRDLVRSVEWRLRNM